MTRICIACCVALLGSLPATAGSPAVDPFPVANVHPEITVTDTASGLVKTYRNEPGNICGQADVRAF